MVQLLSADVVYSPGGGTDGSSSWTARRVYFTEMVKVVIYSYVKEVLDITDTSDYNLSLSSPSYSYFIKQNIEIRLSVNENNTIIVERSGIAVYDD